MRKFKLIQKFTKYIRGKKQKFLFTWAAGSLSTMRLLQCPGSVNQINKPQGFRAFNNASTKGVLAFVAYK